MRLLTLVALFIVALCALAPKNAFAVEARARVQQLETSRGLAKAGSLRATQPRAYRLEAPAADVVERAIGRPSKGTPLQVGFGRDVPAGSFDWETLADGTQVAAVRVTSESAASIRAAVRVRNLPAGATLRFQEAGGKELFEATGAEVNDALARNAEAGDRGPEADLYWSPLIEGDTVTVEVELPAGADRAQVRVSVPLVSHLVTSAAKDFEVVTKAAAACENDAMCSSSTWGTQMNAVARMVFSAGGGTYVCTGTLLADQDATSTVPYFLSANHCISSQTVASTLTTYWFYRSSACNSATPGPYQQLGGGAALLYGSTDTDTSFMRLNNTPPAGTVYAGWYASSTPGFGTSVTGLHHPKGDLLKISTGRLNAYLSCTPPTNGSFTCDFSTGSAGRFYDIGWSSGITEPGSSGSGLFRSDGLLIGQLYGGSGTCTDPADDIYGRFDVAYNAALSRWLAGNSLTVTKNGAGTGSVTSAPAGINCGSTCVAGFDSGTSVTLTATPGPTSIFTGWSGACSGSGACTVSMTQARSVTATFAAANASITVTKTGTGSVASTPAGIDCGGTCAAVFPLGSSVALTATPGRDQSFKGWSGACSGTGACTVTVNAALGVGAAFGVLVPATVTLSSSLNPAAAGQQVTLTANLSGAAGAFGGTMNFTLDGAPLCLAVPVAANKATCDSAQIPPGTHSLVAVYSGDANYQAATSAPLSQTITPAAVNLINLSTRGQVLTGSDIMIGGFVIDGTASKTVVVRAIGPSLTAYGIANALANPVMQLVRAADNTVIASNDDWATAPNAAQISASGFAPSHPLESAVMASLAPGAYTVMISGSGGGTGTGMFEVYAVDKPEMPLINMSTRGRVGTGGDVMIGGFVVGGGAPQTVVVRAAGPSLTKYGIANALANPTLTLVRSSDGATIATNDNWAGSANAAQISASGLAPSDSLEAAILVTLNPGAYTAIVSGVNGTTGTGIIEVYAVR